MASPLQILPIALPHAVLFIAVRDYNSAEEISEFYRHAEQRGAPLKISPADLAFPTEGAPEKAFCDPSKIKHPTPNKGGESMAPT